MTKPKLFLGGFLIVVIAVAGGWYVSADGQEGPAFQTVQVTRGTLEKTVTALGTIKPLEVVEVGAQISGQIEALHVALGDRVAKGDVLAEIDPEVYEAQVAADRADLKGLEAQLRQEKAKTRQAELTHARNQRLFKSNAVSAEDLESSEADLESGLAGLDVLAAQIEKARSNLKADAANLSYTKILAPMAGTVMKLDVSEGQTISARQTTPDILQIADLDTMTVEAQVSEADVVKLHPGMEVWFSTLGDPDRRWTGTLRQILPTPEEDNGVILYKALFDVPNHDHRLMSQMTAQVFFLLGRAKDVPLVPVSALTPVPGQDDAYAVRVETPDGMETRTVTVGLQDRVHAEIVKGLEPEERVVISSTAGSGGMPGRLPGPHL